ncbi:MAG: hypothetical protein ACK5WN_19475, partial [Alphaproteobacteria bacterium]
HQQHGAGGGIAAGFFDHFKQAAIFQDGAFNAQPKDVIIGSKAAQAASAEHHRKRGDDANHGKRTPKADAPGQAAPFGEEIGFKGHGLFVARGAPWGKGAEYFLRWVGLLGLPKYTNWQRSDALSVIFGKQKMQS